MTHLVSSFLAELHLNDGRRLVELVNMSCLCLHINPPGESLLPVTPHTLLNQALVDLREQTVSISERCRVALNPVQVWAHGYINVSLEGSGDCAHKLNRVTSDTILQ